MSVERWDPDTHLELLGNWLRIRKQADDAGDARLYPSTGFVVDQCAIGFLYATNAPHVGYLDGIVTDPAAPARRRHRALERLCRALVAEAESLGIRMLVGSTNVRGLTTICKRQGFITYGQGFDLISRVQKES